MKYILIFLICFITAFFVTRTILPERTKFAAFIRVKDEINTVIPCLNSIDGLFDKIVIIHSNEPDDGSVKAMQKWCKWRLNCYIYEYPHAVHPSHTTNQQTIPYENSLAAYYNFGLEKFEPEEYVVKIDADQIYIRHHLRNTLDFIREQDATDDFVSYGIKGYNTFSYHNKIVKYKHPMLNGGIDSFIIKRKYMERFNNSKNFEKLKTENKIKEHVIGSPSHWFHFMKILRNNGKIREREDAKNDEIEFLSEAEKQEFEQYIRPLLKKQNSIYKNLSF